jgi:DNA-binding response OmpR family regulator
VGRLGRYLGIVTVVLVVDDEELVRDVVGKYLERDGYSVVHAADGRRARQLFEERRPDLVVLDVMLPETNGLDLCRWIRTSSDIPVILLTARGEEADRIVGLELGADDYITKPFSPRELAARVKTVLRRASGAPAPPARLEIGRLLIDTTTREVTKDETPVTLTALEFDLLYFLARHPKIVFSREQLLAQVWRVDAAAESGLGAVTVEVRRLREKVEDDPSDPKLIQTVWGVGYRFVP